MKINFWSEIRIMKHSILIPNSMSQEMCTSSDMKHLLLLLLLVVFLCSNQTAPTQTSHDSTRYGRWCILGKDVGNIYSVFDQWIVKDCCCLLFVFLPLLVSSYFSSSNPKPEPGWPSCYPSCLLHHALFHLYSFYTQSQFLIIIFSSAFLAQLCHSYDSIAKEDTYPRKNCTQPSDVGDLVTWWSVGYMQDAESFEKGFDYGEYEVRKILVWLHLCDITYLEKNSGSIQNFDP